MTKMVWDSARGWVTKPKWRNGVRVDQQPAAPAPVVELTRGQKAAATRAANKAAKLAAEGKTE